MMRELRVEDALMYLDQVKMEFGDRPHIYNEFLDIMKTFKSQQIDTPGVIRRVSNLFQGNKRLVLGFNTFLPEGYKIELPSDESGQVFAVYRSPGQAGVTHIFGPGHPQGPPAQQPAAGGAAAAAGGAAGTGGVAAVGAPPQQQQQQQAPAQRGPGGPPPPGYPAGQQPAPPGGAKPPAAGGPPMQQQQQQGGPPRGPPPAQPPVGGAPPAGSPPQQQQGQGGGGGGGAQQPVEFDHAINYVTTIKKRFASEPETYKKFLEILHTYQKEQRGIKDVLDEVSTLFADHPDLLKDFTYFLPDAVQAQAKAQLEQVAKVAEARKRANASKQAIHGIAGRQRPVSGGHRSAGTSYGPPLHGPGRDPVPFGATQARSEEKEREICRTAIYGIVSFDPVRPPRRQELNAAQLVAKYGRPRMVPELPVQATTTEAAFFQRARAHLTRKELLPDKSPLSRRHTPHTEFLKCLHLFGAGILNRDELVLLLKGLFMQGHAPKSGANAGGGAANADVAAAANQLVKELEQLLVGRGPFAEQERRKKDESKYGAVPSRDYDYAETDELTPSYRTLPSDFPKESFFSHSGQTPEDALVLNDTVVCVAAASKNSSKKKKKLWESPEQYDGIRSRKNFYEEAMAKIEDDHFEVDMAIERNSAAKRQVEPLAEEAAMLRENEEKDGQPIGRLRYKLRSRSLSTNHIGAIARLYGERGDEVLHHLGKNPLCVLPIVWRRLNDKDMEWRKARQELTKVWREACENYNEGCQDVQCYFDRKEIERSLVSDNLLDQCERAGYFIKHPTEQEDHSAVKPFLPAFASSCSDPSAILYQPHLQLGMTNDMPHKDAYQFIIPALSGAKGGSADREKAARIMADLAAFWFGVPSEIVAKEAGNSSANASENGTTDGEGIAGLDPSFNIVFGTEKIYLCLRLYSQLIGVLARAREYLGTSTSGPTDESAMETDDKVSGDAAASGTEGANGAAASPAKPSSESIAGEASSLAEASHPSPAKEKSKEEQEDEDAKQKPTYKGYGGLLDLLKDYLSEGLDYPSYEMYCRKMSKEKVTELSTIPRLIHRIADALMKTAKEDFFPHLYNLTRSKEAKDVLYVRSQSLDRVTNSASYRIQYRSADGYISFTFLPQQEHLQLTAPDDADGVADGQNGEPSAKRLKMDN